MQAAVHISGLARIAATTSTALAWEGACAVAARRWNVPPSALRRMVRASPRRNAAGQCVGHVALTPEATARSVAIYVASVICGAGIPDLARAVGITRPGIRKIMRAIEERRDTDRDLDRALDEIELELMP